MIAKKLTALFFVVTISASAQFVVTTNRVTAAANFREVNGKLYNVDKSSLFQTIHVEIDSVDGKICNASLLKRSGHLVFLDYSTVDVFDGWVPDHEICITNRPSIPVGTQGDVKAMKIGLSATGYELWDCGAPHVVTIVKTNYPGDPIIGAK